MSSTKGRRRRSERKVQSMANVIILMVLPGADFRHPS